MIRSRQIGITGVTSMGGVLLMVLGAFATPEPQSGRGGPVPEDERVHVWWNEELASILGLEGYWNSVTEDGVVRLRPGQDLDCRLVLMEVLTGEVREYDFDRAGEVVLTNGWIMVNQRDHETLGVEGEDLGVPCEPDGVTSFSTSHINKHNVTWMEWSSGSWVKSEPDAEPAPDSSPNTVHSMIAGDSPEGGAVVRYQSKAGIVYRYPEEGSAEPMKLRFRQMRMHPTRVSLLLFCELP